MSASTRSAVFAAWAARARLLAPPVVPRPGEVQRPAGLELEHRRRHRLEEPAVVRDEDHGGVERRSSCSSHSSRSTSRWFVGSSSSSRSGSPASARASDARVSSPPENVVELPVEVARPRSRGRAATPPRVAPVLAAGVLEPRLRLARSGAASPARGRRPPSPPRAARSSSSSATRSRAPESAYSRSVRPRSSGGRWSWSAIARPLREGELPAVHLGLAGEHPQQRRLARAVRAREREPVAALDLERYAVEEQGRPRAPCVGWMR